MDPEPRIEFSAFSKSLHWLIALLVGVELGLGQWMSEAESSELRRSLLRFHQSNGLLIFALVGIRLAWRLRTRLPEWPARIHPRLRQALFAVEGLLYVGMLAMPLTGLSLSMAGGLSISFFGWLEVPSLLRESDLWHERLELAHELGAKLFFTAILGHLGLVLFLGWKASPGFLARMLPSARSR